MKFFYSAGAMGYGNGYWWHRFFNFPNFPLVTKTLTIVPKKGHKWAVLPTSFVIPGIGKSVFNKICLDNIGIYKWLLQFEKNIWKVGNRDVIVSIAGPDDDIDWMTGWLESYLIDGIELNSSCPNIKSYKNKIIPKTRHPLYLKLNHEQDPYMYDLDNISGIRLNSIPLNIGICTVGASGKIAQEKNWKFIKRYNKEGLNVAGCSFTSLDDIRRLEDMGCREIGIGSIILTNPKLVEKIGTIANII